MTLRLGARSGRLIWPRRGHQLSAGPGQQRLHPDHGIEHGRGPSRGLPLGHESATSAGQRSIHVDPRFSRTSASANIYVSIRAGTDIAFLGGLINYVLTHEKWFKEYVLAYTNASTIIDEEFQDTEDLGGIFSGYDRDDQAYDAGRGRWAYADSPAARKHKESRVGSNSRSSGVRAASGRARPGPTKAAAGMRHGMHGPGLMGGASTHSSKRRRPTSADPLGIRRCRTRTAPSTCCASISLDTRRRWYRKCAAARRPRWSASPSCSAQQRARPHRRRSSMPSGGPNIRSGRRSSGPPGILQQLLGNIGRPGGVDHGHARPLLDPGQHRYPHVVRLAPRLPPAADHRKAPRKARWLRRI